LTNPIAKEAMRALTASGYPTENTWCQQFARLVVEKALGGKPMGSPNPTSAAKAALRLIGEGIAEHYVPGMILQPGDLLYKTIGSGGDGHVGIYIGDNKIAENSTVHWKASNETDARGIRTLKQFGAIQVVARFPVPAEKAAPAPKAKPASTRAVLATVKTRPCNLKLNGARIAKGDKIIGAIVIDGRAYFTADVLDAMEARVSYDKSSDTVNIIEAGK
jgi:hypothetical protein